LSLSLKRVDGGGRVSPADEPIEGTPHLDLSEDVFTDAESAPEAPPLETSPREATPGGDAVEREAIDRGDEVDAAAADEVAASREER
jgi:hypothetical protein